MIGSTVEHAAVVVARRVAIAQAVRLFGNRQQHPLLHRRIQDLVRQLAIQVHQLFVRLGLGDVSLDQIQQLGQLAFAHRQSSRARQSIQRRLHLAQLRL